MSLDGREEHPTGRSVEAQRDLLLGQSRKASGAASVRRVADACRALADGGDTITIAAVGKFCVTRWGGPKGQSISNNRDLATLVQMAAQVQRIASGDRLRGRPGSYDDRLLARIPDAQTRSEVDILLVERRSLLNEVNCLKAAFKRVKALELLTPELASAKVETLERLAEVIEGRRAVAGTAGVTDEERAAVREFLDPSRLARMEGWFAHEESGEIRSRQGRPVARRGFLAALRKLVDPVATGGKPGREALAD